jgi:hypothetical protein
MCCASRPRMTRKFPPDAYARDIDASAQEVTSGLRLRRRGHITTRLRFFLSSSGNAAMPSSSGMSTSSKTTSASLCSSWSTASRPVRNDAATVMSCSASTQCARRRCATIASSTTMTRIGRSMTVKYPGRVRSAANASRLAIRERVCLPKGLFRLREQPDAGPAASGPLKQLPRLRWRSPALIHIRRPGLRRKAAGWHGRRRRAPRSRRAARRSIESNER